MSSTEIPEPDKKEIKDGIFTNLYYIIGYDSQCSLNSQHDVEEPTLHELICILNTRLITFAQSHMTTVSLLTLLHLCIPPYIYQQYTAASYSDATIDPVPCDGNGEASTLRQTTAKVVWGKKHKHFIDECNMIRALVTRLMHHLDSNPELSASTPTQTESIISICLPSISKQIRSQQ